MCWQKWHDNGQLPIYMNSPSLSLSIVMYHFYSSNVYKRQATIARTRIKLDIKMNKILCVTPTPNTPKPNHITHTHAMAIVNNNCIFVNLVDAIRTSKRQQFIRHLIYYTTGTDSLFIGLDIVAAINVGVIVDAIIILYRHRSKCQSNVSCIAWASTL